MSDDGTLHCPMPVVREDWDADGMETQYELGVCGEEVYVVFTGTDSPYKITNDPEENPWNGIATEGEPHTVSTWEVVCAGRHVLLVTDCEDRSVPYSASLARSAFDLLSNDESPLQSLTPIP